MKNIIVTGANGFIGSSLVKKLVEKGVKVVAIDILFTDAFLLQSDFVTKIEANIDDKIVDKIPLKDYDAFYHLAWRGVNGSDKSNPSIQLTNIQMAIVCANICKKLNIKKYLCAGTVAENAVFSLSKLEKTNGSMMYGVAKHACRLILEGYCKSISQQFVWMQFSNIYGIGNKTGNLVSYTIGELILGKEATFGPALQPYDFIYIDDLIEAVYRLGIYETDKTFYYIGSGNPRILKEYLLNIGELTGFINKIKIGIRPDDGIKYSIEMFDNTDLRKVIGDYISTDFDNGINKTITWIKSL